MGASNHQLGQALGQYFNAVANDEYSLELFMIIYEWKKVESEVLMPKDSNS